METRVPSATTRCAGCHAVVADIDGPVHEYVPSSPGCWRIFGEVQADQLQRFGYTAAHQLVVDAYMAQHPGDGSDRRDRQSIFIHLAALYARLALDLRPEQVAQVTRLVLSRHDDFPILTRVGGPGDLTVLHMVATCDHGDRDTRAQAWARSVWRSWAAHHCTIAAAVEAVAVAQKQS